MLARLLALSLVTVLLACKDPDGGDGPSDADADKVCAAACEKFMECGSTYAECESDCHALIDFLDMNNPGSGCGDIELGRQSCLSKLTCDDLDLYGNHGDAETYPCKEEEAPLDMCAIE